MKWNKQWPNVHVLVRKSCKFHTHKVNHASFSTVRLITPKPSHNIYMLKPLASTCFLLVYCKRLSHVGKVGEKLHTWEEILQLEDWKKKDNEYALIYFPARIIYRLFVTQMQSNIFMQPVQVIFEFLNQFFFPLTESAFVWSKLHCKKF